MKHILRALCLAATMAPALAAAQVYLPPGVGLPPQSVIGNSLPQSGDAVAVSFAQLRSSLNIPALKTCASHMWFSSLTSGGVIGCSQPNLSDISGFGALVTTFLATPTSGNLRAALTDETGTGPAVFAIGPALVNANLGTPSAAILTNASGLPVSSGISGLGTGVATALGVNVGTGGAVVVNGGALGTPSSGTLTGATGLPISTGVAGLGTGVATALGVNVGSAGAPVVNGGALGTPSSGVATNLTALNATQLTTGTIPAARTNGHQNGTATNDNGAAGEVGEYISSNVLGGSAVALTTGTAANVTSISLTAGDWQVCGNVVFGPNAATTQSANISWISATSATLPTPPNSGSYAQFSVNVAAGLTVALPTGCQRQVLSGTTTVYLGALSNFAVNTNSAYGFIGGRRMR